MELKLTMTCGPYDRAKALIDGTVKPQGIELEVYVNEDPGRHTEIDGKEFDIAEFIPAFTSPTCITDPLATRPFLSSSNDVSPLLYLHQQALRHPFARRPERKTHRRAKLVDDDGGLGARAP